jgi:prepilin-type N-terminal cleavage/methylation domain-containing protein
MIKYYSKQNNTGFSLVETLVAISILLIVVVGPMSISMRTAKSSSFASEQVQAFFLAQEGLELAQKVRDDFILPYIDGSSATAWSNFTSAAGTFGACRAGAGCGLAWGSTAGQVNVTSCATAGNCLLYRAGSGRGRFNHVSAGNEATIFTRTIYIEGAASDPGVRVRSVVTWRTGSLLATQRVEVDTYLYNIYDTR